MRIRNILAHRLWSAPAQSLDEVIDRLPEDVLPRRLASLVREIMAVVDAKGYAGGYRYPMVVEGKHRWFEVSAAAKSTEGRIDWVNPAFEARSGWKLEEVRGRKPGDFLQSPLTDRSTIQRIGNAIRQGQ